jgi:polyhydroxybutyrate depolymerase
MGRIIAGMALVLLCGLAFAANTQRSITVGGVTRTFEVHWPGGRVPNHPVPLVVVFHGGGGNAANAARMTGMDAKADREGFIAVYPDGTGRRPGATMLLTWNTWRCCGAALNQHADDVSFVRALVNELERDEPIDPRRIYATGISNGGMMTYRVGCELSDVFAAIAPVAGALDTDDCHPASPVSVIVFHGTADQHILFAGGVPRSSLDPHPRSDNAVAYAVDFWKKRDGCEGAPARERKGSVVHDAYTCRDGTAVELYAIEGQGHAWPGGQKGRAFGNVDVPTSEISATDVMWEFFRRHPKP